MLKDKKEIFEKVCELAKDRRIKYNMSNKNKGTGKFLTIGSIEELALTEEEKALDDYLNSLDFEDVKMIQTIMYLGRDKDYNINITPEEIYKENRKYMDDLGWNEKHIEVDQMVQKLPLDEYLEDGFKILGIK